MQPAILFSGSRGPFFFTGNAGLPVFSGQSVASEQSGGRHVCRRSSNKNDVLRTGNLNGNNDGPGCPSVSSTAPFFGKKRTISKKKHQEIYYFFGKNGFSGIFRLEKTKPACIVA
jgi:hypothetical protein